MEIQAYVVQYQASNQNKKSQPSQNQQKPNPKKTRKNSSDEEEEPEDLWGDFDDLKISNDNYYDDKSSIINKELSIEEYKEKEKLSSVDKEDRDYNSPFDQKFLNIIAKKLEEKFNKKR